MIVQRGFKRPSSFHSDRLRQQPIGYFFDVMTQGFGQMSSYASQVPPEDRWAIAAYVRALQLSQHAVVAELPGTKTAPTQLAREDRKAARGQESQVSEHHTEEALPLPPTYEPPAADLDRLGRTSLIVGGAAALATAALGFTNPRSSSNRTSWAFIWVFGFALGRFGLMTLHHLRRRLGSMVRRIFEAATRTSRCSGGLHADRLGMKSFTPGRAPKRGS